MSQSFVRDSGKNEDWLTFEFVRVLGRIQSLNNLPEYLDSRVSEYYHQIMLFSYV